MLEELGGKFRSRNRRLTASLTSQSRIQSQSMFKYVQLIEPSERSKRVVATNAGVADFSAPDRLDS